MLVVLIAMVSTMKAQSNYGAVRGIVADAQGAIIAKAQVSLTSEATHITRTTISNAAGEYSFSAVDPGTYTVTSVADGFSQLTHKGIVVDSGNTIPVDMTLTIGSSSQTVEVTASEPIVNSGTSYNGQLIDSQKLQNLPNPGRNPFLFSKLDNSVTPVGDPRFVRFQDQSGSSTISIAGAPLSSNNYSVDGIPITDFSNRAVIIPSIEAVQEVKIQANTYDAEIGRTSGGMFNTTLHSGSSTLHGVLQGETRQTNWGANLFFNNRTPYTSNGVTQPTTPRGAATFYSYVGAIGGPVPLPHILGGKDKTFFWLTEEGYRQRSPLTSAVSFAVPTVAERGGNFSDLGGITDANGNCISGRCIFDPTTSTTVTNSAGKQVVQRKAFVNGIIPTNQISVVGQGLINAYPTPNTSNSGYGIANFNGGDTLGDRADEFVGKLDHEFGSKWAADFYYMHYGSKEPGGNALTTQAGSSSSYLLYRKVDAVGIQNTITLNPTTILTVGFGFNRFPNNTLDISQGFDQTTLGLPTSYVSALKKTGFPAITTSSATNLAYEGTSNSGPAAYFSRNFVTGIAKSLGKHSVKAGYVFRAISLTYTSLSNASGTYAFDTTFTSADNSSTSTGDDAASMLLGYPTSGSVSIPSRLAITTQYHAGYLQDDWRVLPKLTLNLGFRYEYEPGIHERSNHYSVGFDRTVTNPLTATSGVQTLGGVEFAGQNGYPTKTGDMGSKYSPRGGFAYELTPGTVIRGGYGIFFLPLVYSNSAALAPGFVATNSYVATNGGGLPANSINNPFPNGLAGPTGSASGYLTGVGSSLSVIDQGRRAPRFDSYSADLQQQFPFGIAFKLGYVGGHGRNLSNSLDINQLSDANLALGAGVLNASVTNPYYQKGGKGAIGGKTVSQYQLLRPFPAFTTITDLVSDGKSRYNALDVKLQKQFDKGLTVLAAYTWSSNWDNAWGATSTLNPNNNGPQDIYNLAPEYSRAINDIPHRFTLATTYELPFGSGKTFFGGAGRLVNLAVGGWKFNDITIVQSGSPLPITQANNNSSYGQSAQRPTIVAGVTPCKTGSPESRLGAYFNAAAFVSTPQGSYGNSPRTVPCYGPGYLNSDLSLNKDFTVTQRVHIEFRAEALNAFNTPEFNAPSIAINATSTTANSASVGAIGASQGTLGFPRLIQLGGRLTF
ncbi:TonB-dependent receptor [Granulicella arctica]|uniref:TonB-dependent transporter Oar-like beta-barrel domain-containing protein n=1 Tax=Granulicella arctica TaxID=940613 RepID=A0A7Y9TFM2_9BACT|nr:TonB-dependent receptor [Granulicella arctica]NYF77785.1 hypothetical protein [Granulicella arctica]